MLLDEIIKILGSTTASLTEALLKTKMLLHQIRAKDLVPWVNSELDGYPDDNVPSYRIISMDVRGNIETPTMIMGDQALAIQHLEEAQQKQLTRCAVRDSLTIVEEGVKKNQVNPKWVMVRQLPPEATSALSRAYSHASVMSAWCVLNTAQFHGILSSVRTRLLDFALDLRDVVGVEADNTKLVEKSAEVNTKQMFQNAIYGPVGHVYFGSNVSQTYTVNNNQGDIDGLLRVISEIGVPQPDIEALRLAIKDDQADGKTPDIEEGKTGKWYSGIVGRAAKGTLKVAVDVVSKVAAEALSAYVRSK
jgi:hypothetical protein